MHRHAQTHTDTHTHANTPYTTHMRPKTPYKHTTRTHIHNFPSTLSNSSALAPLPSIVTGSMLSHAPKSSVQTQCAHTHTHTNKKTYTPFQALCRSPVRWHPCLPSSQGPCRRHHTQTARAQKHRTNTTHTHTQTHTHLSKHFVKVQCAGTLAFHRHRVHAVVTIHKLHDAPGSVTHSHVVVGVQIFKGLCVHM